MTKRFSTSSLALTIIFASIVSLQSCTKVAKSLDFHLKMQTGSINIIVPATNYTTGTATFGPTTAYYNVDSFIKAQTGTLLGIDNVTSVKVVSVTLTINDATTANNLANLQSCFAEFSSDKDTNPFQVNLPNIPDVTASTISIPVDTSAELKSYIGTTFTYSLSAKLRRPTTADMHCTIQYAFNVEVQG